MTIPPDAHARHVARIRADLRALLTRHVTAEHLLRAERATTAPTTVRAWQETHDRTFDAIAAALDALRRLDAARDFIREHAREIHVDA